MALLLWPNRQSGAKRAARSIASESIKSEVSKLVRSLICSRRESVLTYGYGFTGGLAR